MVGTTQPALWLEALDPGATGSTMVTLWPSLARRKALAIPMAPAPMTTDARELATDLVASATVIVEDMDATLREGGDVIQPLNEGALRKDDLLSYADVVSGKVQVARDKPIVFKFTGMPWEDLALAEAIADKVSAQG